jgi:hypothetical protein
VRSAVAVAQFWICACGEVVAKLRQLANPQWTSTACSRGMPT